MPTARRGSSAPSCTRRCLRSTSAPPAFARVLTACLAKKPEDRWSSAHDVRLLLKGIGAEAPSGIVAMPTPVARRGQRAGWIVAALALAALAVVLARTPWQPAPARPDVLSILPPPGTTFSRGEAPQVSPDGREVAFVATDGTGRTLLYVRSRTASAPRALAGTDDATLPFWAPDSRHLGFFARSALKTVAVSGGTPRTLAGAPVPRGGTWSKDGVIVFVPYPNVQAQQIPAAGGHGHAGEAVRPGATPAMVPLVSPGWTALPVPGRRSHLPSRNSRPRRLDRLHRDASSWCHRQSAPLTPIRATCCSVATPRSSGSDSMPRRCRWRGRPLSWPTASTTGRRATRPSRRPAPERSSTRSPSRGGTSRGSTGPAGAWAPRWPRLGSTTAFACRAAVPDWSTTWSIPIVRRPISISGRSKRPVA